MRERRERERRSGNTKREIKRQKNRESEEDRKKFTYLSPMRSCSFFLKRCKFSAVLNIDEQPPHEEEGQSHDDDTNDNTDDDMHDIHWFKAYC